MDSVPAAASVALLPVLRGPARPVEVVASLPGVAYLSTGDPDCPAICVAAAGAVRVPCAALLPAGVALPGFAVGASGTAGGGAVTIGSWTVRVRRWWSPPRPRLARRPAGDLPDVDALLGAGPGLTPYGDDVLAGALVTLAALGTPVRDFPRLARVFERTTFVSAALLVHAARGECVPQLAAVLTALGTGAPAPVAALRAVGHTSGAGLLAGVRAILPGTWAPA
jgi:Protein of unknown function (DUF2877)